MFWVVEMLWEAVKRTEGEATTFWKRLVKLVALV